MSEGGVTDRWGSTPGLVVAPTRKDNHSHEFTNSNLSAGLFTA
jgi:hypothetical protein